MATTEAPAAPAPARQRRTNDALRETVSKWGLLVTLAALPLYFGIHDLTGDQGNLSRLGENLIRGLSNGSIWALIAVGYTLVYGIIELINFAHGDVFMIGAFTAFSFTGTIGLTLATGPLGLVFGLFLTLLITMAVTGSMNVMIERVAYRPLRNAPKLAPLITAVGFSFILQNVGLLWRGGSQKSVPNLIEQDHIICHVLGVPINNGDLLALGVTVPLVVVLSAFITKSKLGKAMRATAQDPDAARLQGINVDTTISATFLLGGMMAGAAGLIYALYQTSVAYNMGFQAGLIAFTAAVMGGIGNLKGAVLGGLVIGVIQELADNRIGGQWVSAVVFGYLILIMIFRPQGLIGEQTREAG